MIKNSNSSTRLSSFLKGLRVDFGPPEKLAKFFLEADLACRSQGVELEFGNFNELLQVNQTNNDRRPLISTFDHTKSNLMADNSFCILGRNLHGQVVAVHAARFFDWSADQTFYTEGSTLRLFYENPSRSKCDGEELVISASDTHLITGRVVFSGAAWIHPDYRGRRLSSVLPKVVKALALSKFNPDFICSTMNEDVHKKGFAVRFDYPHVDWDLQWNNSVMGSHRFAVVWMTGNELLSALDTYLSRSDLREVGIQRNG
jgi:hypothetical protein